MFECAIFSSFELRSHNCAYRCNRVDFIKHPYIMNRVVRKIHVIPASIQTDIKWLIAIAIAGANESHRTICTTKTIYCIISWGPFYSITRLFFFLLRVYSYFGHLQEAHVLDRATAVNTTQMTPFANIIAMVENYSHFDLKHLGLATRGQSWPFVFDWVFYGFLLLFQTILFQQFWLKRLKRLKRLKHRIINELVCMRCLTQIWLVTSLILRCFFL